MLRSLRTITTTLVLGFALAIIGTLTFGTGSASAKASCESKNGYKYTKNDDGDCKKTKKCIKNYMKQDDKCVDKKKNKVTGDGDCTNLLYRDDNGFECNTSYKDMKFCKKLNAHAVKGINGDRRCIKTGGKTCKGEKGKKGMLEVYKKDKYSTVCVTPSGDKPTKL